MTETWLAECIKRPGPVDKVWPEINLDLAVCMHSMEGFEQGAWFQLDNESVQVSWHFSIMRDGRVFQHYPLEASCWHAGSQYQNTRLIGIEHEGVIGQPLTSLQLKASINLVKHISQILGWKLSITDGLDRRTIYEHSDASATTCPNGRIPLDKYVEKTYEEGYLRGLSDGKLQLKQEIIDWLNSKW